MNRKEAEDFVDALPSAPVQIVAKKLGISVDEVKRQRAESRERLIAALVAGKGEK